MGRHSRAEGPDDTPQDVDSDPAKTDEHGTDWTDEGGATTEGPAGDTDAS